MKIGEKLKFLRNEKDYTLKQLAQITGISISFISDIENGRRKPGLDNLEKLAVGLSVSASELIAEADVGDVGVPAILESNKLDNTEDEFDEISSFIVNLTIEELENIHSRPELIELIKETNNSSREEILKTIRILKALKDK